ncbi:MAG: hypothetical protein VB948_09110 [Pseudomonadales bacterium]|jgi:hypothetical protein
MKCGNGGSKGVWFLIALLAGVGVNASAASADVTENEVGENTCFPAHWCLPGTTGVPGVKPELNIKVGENTCFPAHWCKAEASESTVNVAPAPDHISSVVGSS